MKMHLDRAALHLVGILVLSVVVTAHGLPPAINDPPARPQHKPIHENFTCYREGFVFRPTNWDEAIVEEQPARSVMFTSTHHKGHG
jgi:hypothetical protein